MALNVTTITGATGVRLYFRNYSYSSALSDLAALETVHFTDLDRVGYKNTAGTLRKFLEDASGATNIPANRVLYTDGNGRATYATNFLYDGTSLTLPPFTNGWSFNCTATKFEVYKDGAAIGCILAEV